MNERPTIAITGASGFIGGELMARFRSRGFPVLAMQRTLPADASQGSCIRFALNEPFEESRLDGIECLVHCAVQVYSPRWPDADRVNVEGTRKLLDICAARNIRFIFLSTLSAHEGARSHYGRHKLQLEGIVLQGGGLVLKLGLVLGQAGLFHTIRKLIERSKVIPLIGGGNQPIQTITMEDVFLALEKCIHEKVTGLYHLAEPRAIPIRELYRCIAEKCHRQPVFVPVPLTPMLLLVKAVERLGVALPLGSENILGLKHLRVFDTQPDLHKLGVRLKDFRTSLDELLS